MEREHIAKSHAHLDQIAHQPLVRVIIESPLASPTLEGWVLHKKFAKACLRDSLMRGEAPYASHLLYAQEGLLDDDNPHERAVGIHAGLIWGEGASKSVVYEDLGISSGMKKGIERALADGRAVEYRRLGFIPVVLPEEIELEAMRRKVQSLLAAEQAEHERTPEALVAQLSQTAASVSDDAIALETVVVKTTSIRP